MIQRSPTYFMPGQNVNETAEMLRPLGLDPAVVHDVVRRKILFDQDQIVRQCREAPEAVTTELLAGVQALLPEGFDMKHFTPSYNPWDQRLCVVPDGDLFKVLKKGKADIVTDHIDTFVENGIKLKSGQVLEADIIITATGLDLQILGGLTATVDGAPVNVGEVMSYKGVMMSSIPNFAMVFGYTNASWTLKADLAAEFVCRVLNHMDKHGYTRVVPNADGVEADDTPMFDLEAGYMKRAKGSTSEAIDTVPGAPPSSRRADSCPACTGTAGKGCMRRPYTRCTRSSSVSPAALFTVGTSTSRCPLTSREGGLVGAALDAVLAEGDRIRAKYPILQHQDAIGMAILLFSMAGAALTGWAYLEGMLAWYVTIPVIAIFLSFTHELEHDLIHYMYFRKNKLMHNLMMALVWVARPSTVNPWLRRHLHLHHHKHSGTETDLEERAITNGERFTPLRLLMMLDLE